MKTWTILASCLTVLTLSVAACADHPAAPLSADAEKAVLIERARELKADVVAEGTMTVEHMRAVDKLTTWCITNSSTRRTGEPFGFGAMPL